MLVKIHESYRKVIAICDAELLGKKFEDEEKQIEILEPFYGGEKMHENAVIELMKDAMKDDATFNLVGKKTISAALKAGIIEKEGIIKISDIPHALVLL
ncbi:DUF424 family protein [Candidatus Pacearchaeota archaeon]|nr:DUF424 family protein [Candidatus Pacearchaeota archaeon]